MEKAQLTKLIIDALTFLLALAISAFALIKGAQAYFEQNNVGKKGMKDLDGKVSEVKQEFEELKREIRNKNDRREEFERKVAKLEGHIDELIRSMFQYMNGPKR